MELLTQDTDSAAKLCAEIDPGNGVDKLLTDLHGIWPMLSFQPVLTRGGWYRPGGVVDAGRNRVSDNLRQWAESLGSDEDLLDLLDACQQEGLLATRLVGRTHYLTAPTGDEARAFVQFEVEELEEVLDRDLSDPDWLPDTLEEVIDPADAQRVEAEAVAPPRLLFRRAFSVSNLFRTRSTRALADVARFLADWDRSSAAGAGHFCTRWMLAVRQYNDSDGDIRIIAHPVPAKEVAFPAPAAGTSGEALANWVHAYDREAGWPMAWYFHMVAAAGVPHAVGMQIAEDHKQGYGYLPERDIAVLGDWVATPYRA